MSDDIDWGPDGSKEAFLKRIRAENAAFMQHGIAQGWWKGVNAKGEPLPNDIVISIKTLSPEDQNMPSIMLLAKRFDSKGEAKRNGWKGPPVLGDHVVKKQVVKIVP